MSDTELLLLVESRKKSGWLAALLNLFLPGAGYIYCGRWILGIVAFFLIVAMLVASLGLLYVPLAILLFIDGFLCAGRYNRKITEELILSKGALSGAVPHTEKVADMRRAMTLGMHATKDETGREATTDVADKSNELERKCPYCAETIKFEAVKCRFCGSAIERLISPCAVEQEKSQHGTSEELVAPGNRGKHWSEASPSSLRHSSAGVGIEDAATESSRTTKLLVIAAMAIVASVIAWALVGKDYTAELAKAGIGTPPQEIDAIVSATEKALEDQLSCERNPEPGKAIRAMLANGLLRDTNLGGDGLAVLVPTSDMRVYGKKLKFVAGFEMENDGRVLEPFGRVPGTTPSNQIEVILDSSPRDVRYQERRIEKVDGVVQYPYSWIEETDQYDGRSGTSIICYGS